MSHADDEGMVVPPAIAPHQIVIVPLYKDESKREAVAAYAEKLRTELAQKNALGEKVRVKLDNRQKESVDKMWEWTRKGAPLIVEVGPRDLEKNALMVRTRIRINDKEWKSFVGFDEFVSSVSERLESIQSDMFNRAKKRLDDNVVNNITTPAELEKYFANQNVWVEGDKTKVAFVRGKWCGDDDATVEKLKEMKITIRCIPFDQSGTTGTCLITGKPATLDVIYARSY